MKKAISWLGSRAKVFQTYQAYSLFGLTVCHDNETGMLRISHQNHALRSTMIVSQSFSHNALWSFLCIPTIIVG